MVEAQFSDWKVAAEFREGLGRGVTRVGGRREKRNDEKSVDLSIFNFVERGCFSFVRSFPPRRSLHPSRLLPGSEAWLISRGVEYISIPDTLHAALSPTLAQLFT